MSASPVARSITQSQSIPAKRMLISDPSQLPCDYSTTPGGTLYSTTPGGTRIVYERSTLMFLRNSPLSKTPPNIPDLPDSLSKGEIKHCQRNGLRTSPLKKTQFSEDRGEQFEIDI
ncbi:eukaryotic translation initiation factor 4E-binding protein [Halyomorpha halys]|uniref:eukaryotic translation initiation factor 4E-binding protein n=1 Tax=Halyomorpha halys TaxID=286706 RepID=UPI0006D50E55|nr:eukaryotic translation initiation factor 4E-binding protein 2 [Halyomorpha halys]